jgi:hypothetical protein
MGIFCLSTGSTGEVYPLRISPLYEERQPCEGTVHIASNDDDESTRIHLHRHDSIPWANLASLWGTPFRLMTRYSTEASFSEFQSSLKGSKSTKLYRATKEATERARSGRDPTIRPTFS